MRLAFIVSVWKLYGAMLARLQAIRQNVLGARAARGRAGRKSVGGLWLRSIRFCATFAPVGSLTPLEGSRAFTFSPGFLCVLLLAF